MHGCDATVFATQCRNTVFALLSRSVLLSLLLRPSNAARIDVSSWPSGNVEVWAAFQTIVGMTAKQPADLIVVYGEVGERLTGENVTTAGSMKRVELTAKLRL